MILKVFKKVGLLKKKRTFKLQDVHVIVYNKNSDKVSIKNVYTGLLTDHKIICKNKNSNDII